MAIDMTTVTAITHNNKDVVKIEDSNGNILWQKNTGTLVSKTYKPLVADTTNGSYLVFSYDESQKIANVAQEYGVSTDKVSVVSKKLTLHCYRNKTGNSYMQFRTPGDTSSDAFGVAGPYNTSVVYVEVDVPSSKTSVTGLYGFTRSSSTSTTFTAFKSSNYWYFEKSTNPHTLTVVFKIED